MKIFYESIIIAVIFFLICFIYKGQQRITLNGGKAWDGVYYYSMTEQLQAGSNPIVGELPFIRRLGTPFLIARFSAYTGINILDSAFYLNMAGAFITVLLLFFWLRKFFSEFWISVMLCFLFMMAWYAPVRYSFYVPLTSDPWGAVWFTGGLILLDGIRRTYYNNRNGVFIGFIFGYSFVIAVGVLFRESNAFLCVLPFFVLNPLRNTHLRSDTLTISHAIRFFKVTAKQYYTWKAVFFLIPVLLIVAVNILIDKSIKITGVNDYSYLQNVLSLFFTKSLPEYILGILIAFGPLILLVPFYCKQYKSLLWENQELLVLLIVALIFGFIGGTDTERILCMAGFPVILLILGISIKNLYYSSQRWWLYVLFILQTIAFRFFWMLPDHTVKSGHTPIPFFGLMSSNIKYLYLYSHFSNYIIDAVLLIEYFILFLATAYVILNRVKFKNGPGQLVSGA